MATSSTTKKLEALRGKVEQAKRREVEIREEQAAALEAVREADRKLEEHFAQPEADPEPSGLLGERAVALDRAGQPWEQKIAGARRQTAEAESALAAFAIEHVGELIGEAEPEAKEAAEAVRTRAAELTSAIEDWHAVSNRIAAILRWVPGIDGRDILRAPFDGLHSELRRLRAVEIPPPLPRSLYSGGDGEQEARARAVEAAVGPAD